MWCEGLYFYKWKEKDRKSEVKTRGSNHNQRRPHNKPRGTRISFIGRIRLLRKANSKLPFSLLQPSARSLSTRVSFLEHPPRFVPFPSYFLLVYLGFALVPKIGCCCRLLCCVIRLEKGTDRLRQMLDS